MLKTFIEIVEVRGREILDSCGNPTVEVQVVVCDEDGKHHTAIAAVPSDAPSRTFEMRDGGERYLGLGVEKTVSNINDRIANEICGMNALDQAKVDQKMLEHDGTPNKENLGVNAILGISMAVAKAAATALKLPLYQYLGGFNARALPVPMMNIVNAVDFQEFMIVPVGAINFNEALQWCAEIYHTFKDILKSHGLSIAVGDDGGFITGLATADEVIELILEAIAEAGYEPETEIRLALGAANKDISRTAEETVQMYEALVGKYPIVSIECDLDREDSDGWRLMTERLGDRVQIVSGDASIGNSVLIKLNQIGTLTEAFSLIALAQRNNMTTVISHCSGETEDTTIADISVAVNAGQIKTGAPARSDRVAKYNQLLRIEEELDDAAEYPGLGAWYNLKI